METKIFKSINLIRCVSGANLNLFRYATMVLVLLTLGVGNAWAGHGGKCTAKLQVNKGTGSGSVYAATTGSATSGSSSASADCGDSDSGTHTHTLYAFATPADGYTFLGWTESATSTAGADASNPKAVTITSNNHNTVTKTLYAHFVEKAKVNITFEAPSHGTYTIAVNGGSAETVSSADVVKNNVTGVTLTATPASGYAFAGWYKLNSAGEFVEDLSIASPYDAAFTESETIKMGARFVPTTLGKFILKGSDTQYYGLKAATVAAGGSGTIVPVADETVVDGSDLMPFDNGSYILKAKLLIPYESGNTWQILPKVVKTAATLSAYKKLILMDGVDIVVNSGAQICIGGQAMAASGSGTDGATGYTTGACGVLDMSRGGHLELNNGSTLYCWGFVKGQDMDQGNNTVGVGTITVNSGATVWESFSVGDWRGGTATGTIANTRFFPFQSYFMQNIEVPTTYLSGSSEWCYFVLNATGGPYDTQFKVIGNSNCLFKLTDAQSRVRKWYDPTTDLMCYELGGTAVLDALRITIDATLLNIDVNSEDFDLPITSNMHLILADCNMNLTKPLVVQPGAIVEIKNSANVTLTKDLFLYDKDDWGPWVNGKYFKSRGNLTTHKNRGNGASNEFLDDAKFIIDGSFTIGSSGKLYSTAGGAALVGNGGGYLTYSSSLTGSVTSLRWYKSTTTSGDGETGTVAVNVANLCNEDESYTKAIASTTFYNVHGRWFKSGNQNEKANHTYDFTYISSGAVSGTSGTSTNPAVSAVYAPDKTGLTAGMKWCNVVQDGTCSNIYNATQALNETPASDIRYTYPSDSWLQLLRTETEGVYGGSDNSLYAVDGCAVNSLGSVDENCLYTIGGVKKALVDGHFVALEKNTEDEAWHDVANPTNYYICFEGCNWHPATKYAGEEKAYIVEEGDYIWYNNDWLLVEREDPFFFDYNDQNVKRYYEYEDGAWVLASPRVRVVDAIETRDFYKLPEAITVASGKKNATITILKDISGINTRMTYTAKNTTCTLDLNGHTVSGAAPFGDDNNRGLLIINASGTTFTITDNSANKEGRLENICNQNKVTYVVHLMAGTLNVEHGTIHAENPAQYASKDATVNDVAVKKLDACGARAVQVSAAQKLNISGGRLEAFATRNAFGIVASGNNANTTQVTITDGEIYAEAPCGAYAINCLGKLNVSGGLIEAKLNDHLVDASYAADNADNNIKKHQTCYGIYMQGSANKAATSCYFGTLTMTGGTVKATSDVAADYTSNVFGINLYADFAGTGAANTKATDGTLSQKYAAKATIENAKIEVNTKANYGYGIIGYGRYNSADKSTSVIKIKNTEVDVYARTYAYGILSSCRISTGTGNGGCTNADIELTNCDVYAETTIGANAYAVWSSATQGAVYEYTYKDGVATATNSIYAGEYAIGANMTVHSGRYEAKTKTSGAYASGTSTKQINTYSRHSGTALYQQLGGQVEAYSTLNIEDGTFIATAGTETARAVSNGGNTTITGGTFEATATTRYAYCIYAISGTLNVSNATITATSNSNTANGIHLEGTVATYTMFAYAPTATLTNLNVTATTGTGATARALYVTGATRTQTEAQKEALTSSNRNNYYNIYQVGEKAIAPTVTVHGGTYTATAGTSSAYGAHSPGTSISTNKVATASPVMNLYNATFVAQTGTSTSAYGVSAGGPTLIDGCTITATAGNATKYQSTASGVRAVDKTTTIKNSTITATATDAAYGLEGYVEINATHGYCFHGEFDLSEAGNTEVTAEAKTKAKTSYAIYLNATKKAIASGNFAGDYATAANATINGGTYVAKFNTSGTAYVISLGAKQTQGSVVAQPEVEVLDGFFNGATAEVGTAGVVGHMQLKGGYFVHPTNLATYAVAPKSVWTLPNTHEHYNPYKYKVTEHYTITFKNGTTQLQQNDLEAGTTPTYSGTPTKDADAQYTYTFDGWSTADGGDKLASLPAVSAAATYFAHFTKTEQKYSVDVTSDGHGSVSPAAVSNIGCKTASGDITATPATGYSFSGWILPEGVTVADGYTTSSNPIRIHAMAADKTITANFAAKNYTVTLDNQSATTAGQASVKATYGETMPSIAANLPTKTGHEFGGYYSATNGGGTQYYNGSGASARVWDVDAASPVLYAKWTPKDYTITYLDKDGAAFSGVQGAGAPMKHTYGTATALVDPSKDGYTFLGWYTSEDCSTEPVTSLGATAYTADITLYAKWKQNKVTVTWDANGGAAAEPATTEVIPGEAVGTLATTSKAGYTYKWYTAPTGGTEVTEATIVSENKKFYAQWTEIMHEVTLAYKCGETSIQPSGSVNGVGIATAQSITAPAITGYTFANWTLTGGVTSASTLTNATISINATADEKTITANYTKNSHALTWNWDGGSTSSTTHTTGSVAYGTTIVYPAASTMTRENYVFSGWSIENASMPDDDLTITAQWTSAVASVTAGGTPTYYKTIQEAFTAAKSKTNPTIKLLQDVSMGATTLTYDGANTCTLDLNGQILSGTATRLLIVDKESAIFTVTDNSDSKLGQLSLSTSSTVDAAFCALVNKGKLYVEAGTISLYSTSTEKNAVGLRSNANGEFIMNGGTVHVEVNQSGIIAYGTQSLGNATINGGTICAKSDYGQAYALFVSGENATMTINGGKFHIIGATAYVAHPSYSNPTKLFIRGGYYNIDSRLSECIVAHYRKKTLSETHPEYANGYRYTVDNLYTVTWKNHDDAVLKTDEVAYGATPEYEGATPTKDADERWVYTFDHWTPDIEAVTEDIEYKATFAADPRPYTITWLNADGELLTTSQVGYGSEPSYPAELDDPTYSDGVFLYEFRGWTPTPVEVNGEATYTAQYKIGDLLVQTERTIPVSANVDATTVEVSGRLNIEQNMTLTTDNLILEATPSSSGEIIGDIEATQKAYFDLSNGTVGFKAKTWYAVAVPWQVEVTAYGSENGVYLYDGEHYTRQVLGSTFDLLWYDGAERAKNGPSDNCWVYIEDDQLERHEHYTMLPGRAYMIYLTKDAQTIRFERKQDEDLLTTTADVYVHPQTTGHAEDANWNGIANPATYHAYMNAASGNMGQIYVAIEDRYVPINDMSETPLVVGQPVFVQSTETKSVVAYTDNTDFAAHAPRRMQSDENASGSIEVRIGQDDNSYTDRLYISMDRLKEDTYVIGEDLAKAGVSRKVAQMWVERYNARLCANVATATGNSAVYPLGIYAPQSGEYTIYLPNECKDNENVFLTLNGRVIWNLTYAPYVANIESGMTNTYGLKLVRSNAPAVTTGTEEIEAEEHDGIRKYLIDDIVYIMRDGVMYTVTGQIAR